MYELGIRIQSSDGFRIDQDEYGATLVWNSSVAKPSVTFRTVQRPDTGVFDSAGAAIQPEWALFPIPPHGYPTNVSIAKGQAGVVGDQLLLLGSHDVYERKSGCHDIRLFVPDAVETAEPPSEIISSLKATGQHLDIGWRYDTVRVFAVGDPIRLGGRAFTHEVWVHAGSRFDSPPPRRLRYPPKFDPPNVWAHEYVHTRQRWLAAADVSPDARWLTEAIPSYYMLSETERQGLMDAYNESRYWFWLNESLRLGDRRINLTKPDTYRRIQDDYTRGAYVLAALDAEIRDRTGGRKSLKDVFRRLNHQPEVNHSAFRAAVVEVGGKEMGPWVDRYVSGTEVPPAPTPPPEVHFELLFQRRSYQAIALLYGGLVLITLVGIARYHGRNRG